VSQFLVRTIDKVKPGTQMPQQTLAAQGKSRVAMAQVVGGT
jgi:hypothetical protein